ncbi:hypothetical protein L228DRAFT_235625 [Xylona heveae TC161]|uniref:Homeobox domain-containing protein n=1 Tax=Xylona heveae (strain CBS 132557 / TC161) TaxID=1328760 RepID=A0A165JSN9_XYLHT|nr:hypothetical protein L228DRAFT_235625 [Xylona heveae TC161]KZF26574.1 hypothetical protein L228DRAFT_235625 [Xylona heveae TC161]
MSTTTASTPSPTATATTTATTSSSGSRRPPRKSTLTQQQKNQKRQRATQDQLLTLEHEFNKNPTPTALVRERIAQDINMTERSVQIWFQNRRAKIKMIAKRSIETGEDCEQVPESMRHYLMMQAIEHGLPLGRSFLGRSTGTTTAYGNGIVLPEESSNSGKTVIQHFACRSLSIGTWRRVGQQSMDLVLFYSPDKACVTYYINSDSAGYKIEYPFSYIKNISLDSGDALGDGQGGIPRPAGLVIELNRSPQFYTDSSGSGGFMQCEDFTEDHQASQMLVHHLGGHPKVLSGQLAKLVSLESFQNRHAAAAFDMSFIPPAAPVSPIEHRPASQPNGLSRPHMAFLQESPFGPGLTPGRGHKRTRSRSVPVAIDFSALQQPMPPFMFQSERPAPPPMPTPDIFSPTPQHFSSLNGVGPDLRIDTSTGFNMDFRQYPLSATATSPSEYASPSFFAPGSQAEPMPLASFNTPYNMPFLSPMTDPTCMGGPSISPLSAMSHGDPVIADQSPPLSAMHGANPTDIFAMSQDPSGLDDDGVSLSDLYSKQSLGLPVQSPGLDGSDDFDMHNLVSFGTIDPSHLSPDNTAL